MSSYIVSRGDLRIVLTFALSTFFGSAALAQLTPEELRRASQAGLVEKGYYESGGKRVMDLPKLAPQAYEQKPKYVPRARARREAREAAARKAEQQRISNETDAIVAKMKEAKQRYQQDIAQLKAQYQQHRSTLEAATNKLAAAKKGLKDYNKTRNWFSNTFVVSSEERWREQAIESAEAQVKVAKKAANTTATALSTTMRNAQGVARAYELQAVKVDPEKIKAVAASRVRQLEATYDRLQTQKAQIREGEISFAKRKLQLEASISNASRADNDNLVAKLETEKKQLAETHTMWRRGMKVELTGYKKDLQREYQKNRSDGIGPSSTSGLEYGLRQNARAAGQDPDVVVGKVDQAVVARTRAMADMIAGGAGKNTEHVNIFDNPASFQAWADFNTEVVVGNAKDIANATDIVGNAEAIYEAATTGNLKKLKQQQAGLLRIYNYGLGVTEGSVTAVVDLGILAKDVTVLGTQAADHSLSFWLGTKPIFEDASELKKAHQFASVADTIIFDPYGQGGEAAVKIVDGLSKAVGSAGRGFEKMAGRGQTGVNQAMRLTGNVTGQIVDPLTEGLFLLKPLDKIFDVVGVAGDAAKFADNLPPPGATNYGDSLLDMGGRLRLDGPGPREVFIPPSGAANDATQFFPAPGQAPGGFGGVDDATGFFPPPGSGPGNFPGANDATQMFPGQAGSPGGFGLADDGTQLLPPGSAAPPAGRASKLEPWDEFGSNAQRIPESGAPAQVVTDNLGTPKELIMPNGERIPLTQELGAGSTSVAYKTPDGKVVKVTKPGEGALDDYGYEVIKNIDPDGAAIQIPTIHSRQALDANNPNAEFKFAGEGNVAEAQGATVRVMDEAPKDFRSARREPGQSGLPKGEMTLAQKQAYDRGMEALNRNGYVFLDNKPDNYAFKTNDKGDLVLVIVDPGGIIPMRGRNADVARQMQLDMDNPQKLRQELIDQGLIDGDKLKPLNPNPSSPIEEAFNGYRMKEMLELKYGDATDYAELNRRLGITDESKKIASLDGSKGESINYNPNNWIEAPNAGAPRGDIDLPAGVRDPAKPETLDPLTGDALPGGAKAIAERSKTIKALEALRNSDYYPWLGLFWDHRTLQLMTQINKQYGADAMTDFVEQAGGLFDSGTPVPPGIASSRDSTGDRPVTGSSRPITGVNLPDTEGVGSGGGLISVGGGVPISTVPALKFHLRPVRDFPPPPPPESDEFFWIDGTEVRIISVLPSDQNNPFDFRDPINPDSGNSNFVFVPPPSSGGGIVIPPTTPPPGTPTSVPLQAISIGGGDFVLTRDLSVSPPDACPGDHYHAFSPVFSCFGSLTFDPNPTVCGFGIVGTVEVTINALTQCPNFSGAP